MMFYMTSKVFQDYFLTNERDDDILKAQYVIVSTRINSQKKVENIVNAKAMLFPDANVCNTLTEEDFRDRYFGQLEDNEALLATLIKGSIEEGYNIIFMCTHKERKLKYLNYISSYVAIEFGYPIYEYSAYAAGITPLEKYDKKEVLKKCEKILKRCKEKDFHRKLQSSDGKKSIMKEYKSMKKSELKAILKEKGLYQKDMDKEDMLDMIETFL